MALTLTVPAGPFHLAGNPLWVKVEGASQPPGSIQYKVLLRITSVDGEIIGGPFVDGKAPTEGIAWFDVSGYVNQPFQKNFDWPLVSGMGTHTNDTHTVTFQPGESWIDEADNLVENWGETSDGYFIVNGGLGPRRMGEYQDLGSSFYNDFVEGGKFLTWMPDPQVVHPWQPIKLWLLAAESRDVMLHIKAWYEDGTTGEWINPHGLHKDIMHEINCLPYHSGWDTMPPVKPDGTRMTHYEVWIEGVTQKRTFLVDHSYHENNNFLFVLNSLGGLDVVWLNGEVTTGFDTSAVEATRQFSREGSVKERTIILASRTGRRTWKISTGWKSRQEIQALEDLLLSRQVWLLKDGGSYKGGTLYPVNIANASTPLTNSMNDLQAITIEMVEAHDSQFL